MKGFTLFCRLVIKLIFVCGFDLFLVVNNQYFHDCAIIIKSGLDEMRLNMTLVPFFLWPLVFKTLVFLDDGRMVMLKKVCGWVAVLAFCCLSAHHSRVCTVQSAARWLQDDAESSTLTSLPVHMSWVPPCFSFYCVHL